MRVVVAVLAVAALHLPAVAQQPGRGPGQGPGQRLPDHWVPFDSLAQAIQLSDAQRAAAQALHTSIDSIVRHGATVRAEMRQEMQRNPDREQMMRFQQRLQAIQQQADRLIQDLRAQLTEEQKAALAALRAPTIAPPRRQGT